MSVAFICLSEEVATIEVLILKFITVVATIAHVHYGVCVVRQMADHFDIDVFSIKRKMQLNHHGNDKQKLLNKHAVDAH